MNCSAGLFMGAFHSTQNSGNFAWFIKWNGPFRFGPTGIFGTSFEGGPQWPVWFFGRSDRNVPFHLPKLLSPVPLFCILITRTSSFHWKVKYCEESHDISNSLNQLQFFFDFWYLSLTVSNNWHNTTRRWKKCVYKVRVNQRIICLKPAHDI